MKKFFFMAATAALALSSCSSDELVQTPEVNAQDEITFGVYTGRANRASTDQNITTASLQTKGFGVFAYEQGAQNLTDYLATNTVPNFIYNDKVAWVADPGEWKLVTAKYWPNNNDKVTFQAYAPHDAAIKPLFNALYKGVGIRYSINDNYDLLWGYATNSAPKVCYYDQQKPDVASKLDWTFQHALSKVDISVAIDVDDADCSSFTNSLEAGTKVTIRSVKLIGVGGTFPTQGVLSLYDGSWTVERTDGDWGFSTEDFCWTNVDRNAAASKPGVFVKDSDAQLFSKNSLMVIPFSSDSKAIIEIVYDVESGTYGTPNYSCVTNTIKSTDVVGVTPSIDHYGDSHNDMTDGKISILPNTYNTINIHIGLTSVKFMAQVDAWTDTNEKNIDMPANFPAGLTVVEVTELPTAEPSEVGYWLDGTTVEKFDGSSSTESSELNGEVIKAGDKYYSVTDSGAELMDPQPTPLYLKAGRLYTNEGCTTLAGTGATGKVENLTAGYYVIGGKVYKKESATLSNRR